MIYTIPAVWRCLAPGDPFHEAPNPQFMYCTEACVIDCFMAEPSLLLDASDSQYQPLQLTRADSAVQKIRRLAAKLTKTYSMNHSTGNVCYPNCTAMKLPLSFLSESQETG